MPLPRAAAAAARRRLPDRAVAAAARRRLGEGAAAAWQAVRTNPRHLLLGCLVLGLLAAPAPALVVMAAAIAATILARRPELALAAAVAVLGGAVLAQARQQALDRSALRPLLGQWVQLQAHLLERPRATPAGSRRALAAISSDRAEGWRLRRGERIVVSLGRGGSTEPARGAGEPGQEVSVTGRLVGLRPTDDHLRRRGAHARLLADRLTPTGRRRGGVAGALDTLRARAERAVTAGLDPPRAALARGMVLGQDEALTEVDREAFRASGLAHLLAASGQNVMLLAALALPALAALGLGLRGRLAGAILLIALYVPLAGAGPSIQRAGIMGAAGMVAALAGRPASRWYAVLLAAAFTLTLNPRAAADPGWQLSFAAVVAILALAGPTREALTERRVPRALAEAAAITAAATLATAPLLAFHFERLSAVSLPANLLAAPAVAPVMWLGVTATCLGLLAPALAEPVNLLAQFPLAFLGWLAQAAAGLPGASVSARIGSPLALAAAYTVLALLMWGWVRGGRGRRLAAAATVVAAAGGLWAARPPPPPDPRAVVVSFLDVGQGDATLIQHGGASVLFDTGPPGSPVLERLRGAGVRRLDLLVVTHAQADHEGEAASILERVAVGKLLDAGDGASTPEHRRIVAAAQRRRVRALTVDVGQTLTVGPLRLRVLWPPREPPELHAGEDPNQRALVVHLQAGAFDLLLPADAESEVTAGLALPEAEALKVAHHGSEDLGLPDTIARVRPRLAVIEVGRRNTYGHPTAQALGALRAVPAVYRTDRDGTVRLTVADGRMRVTTDR